MDQTGDADWLFWGNGRCRTAVPPPCDGCKRLCARLAFGRPVADGVCLWHFVLSAVIFVGYAGHFGWRFGVASTWIGLGNAFLGSLLAWVVLGRRTRLLTRKLDSATMPEFFGRRYDSQALKIGASLIIFVFLIPYTASLYNGLSPLFAMAFHIDYTVCILLMAVLTGVYVIAGGYMATAINDFIQGIIMLGGIVAVVAAVLNTNGGFIQSLSALAQVEDPATQIPGVFASFFGPDPLGLLSVVILTSLGTWGLPQMVQKFYAIKSEKSIDKGTIISTIFAVVVAGGCYFLGGFGRLFTTQEAVTRRAMTPLFRPCSPACRCADRRGGDPGCFPRRCRRFPRWVLTSARR